jgi:predicted anti-sigma-YlaC factor YlaD
VRESLSAQLDGELPELEELASQRAHLRGCADCAAWAEDVKRATLWLREAPLEEPAISLARPRFRRARGTASVALVAAAAASVVAVLGSFQSLTGSSQPGRYSDVSLQGSAPTVTGLELERLGLASLPARSSTSIVQTRLRAV